ncbi:MAG: alkaline phosphatase family protein [Actinomycetota bacterium]|nr:alkaline phosphatase family protein [Actinomycetota bacterium]
MANLVLGPCLRYVSETEATVWVETDAACEVDVLGRRARTFHVEGHHYALVVVDGLGSGESHPYEVALDGEVVWPERGSDFPPSVIRTVGPARSFTLTFGSCRDAAPHHPPYTLTRDEDERGRGIDALGAYAWRMMGRPSEHWPDALLLLGDQVYADEPSPATRKFVAAQRQPGRPPEYSIANFEEYTRLYAESWRDPVIRWLLSTVSTSMIFDDHDIRDDWNTSAAWVARMRAQPWWQELIVGGLMAYWLYQHLGNLSPSEHVAVGLLARLQQADDAGPILREFAARADREPASTRWSYRRDFGGVRLVVIDSRCGRVLGERRDMLDEQEWGWVDDQLTGDVDHLLVGTSLPYLLGHGTHNLEAWNEAVCDGAWGGLAARVGERIRQAADLEHWAAFGRSFRRLALMLRSVASGRRGTAPASIVLLSGDVHHAYLAEASFPDGRVSSRVHQAVCSPLRNPLEPLVRRVHSFSMTRTSEVMNGLLARAAGWRPPPIDWRITHGPWFNNQVATLRTDGRTARLELERSTPGDSEPRLVRVLDQELTGPREPAGSPPATG